MSDGRHRASGVLLHISSLPEGHLGGGRAFVDWLVRAGQTVWQVLPLGPTGYGGSPYQTFSSFAGEPGLLDPHGEAGEPFVADWLEDYVLFASLKGRFDGKPWNEWPSAFAQREAAALKDHSNEYGEEIDRLRREQFAFQTQWQALKGYANESGVQLVGDCPIYVAYDSADVWCRPELFDLNPDGTPREVAGVPPDYFSETGQRWGNPLYLWSRHFEEDFAWWKARLGRCVDQFDVTRIDHFRGFDSYWAIPASCDTAIEGAWCEGPGEAFFNSVREAFGGLPFIAEDLGLLTESVHELRRTVGLPGMRVLQFGMDGSDDNPHAPANISYDSICYTGTHDNDTTIGWYHGADDQTRGRVDGLPGEDPSDKLMRVAAGCDAGLCVHPMQDVLRLDGSARLNTPGTVGGCNWQWQLSPDVDMDSAGQALLDITRQGARLATSST